MSCALCTQTCSSGVKSNQGPVRHHISRGLVFTESAFFESAEVPDDPTICHKMAFYLKTTHCSCVWQDGWEYDYEGRKSLVTEVGIVFFKHGSF